ncbi:hypothetical protein A3H26_03865 [candidate division WWE3 bacterium RIFCSPLOWO2_12_FULL_36_10]|uniref:DUF4145 domain-containing protein n=1 Tax=candidate division WWE3 bacterium RIFCSPLOWO2_12_FULL_36_10 TaxID=1802630 RepID=A0A1F4VK40_UNCKA|nr:MAG: hypothetical protein A3H26_03865 [candidate division WWE3 bacterium RIFCSPLOWO2_12_FULL_36_10]
MSFLTKLLGLDRVFSRSTVSSQTEDKIKVEWKNINILLAGKAPSQLRQALISADKCLDNALGDIVDGKTLGERLKKSQNKFDRNVYNNIWEAHKIRNSLIHESGYEPPHFMLTKGIDDLKRGLEALGVFVER